MKKVMLLFVFCVAMSGLAQAQTPANAATPAPTTPAVNANAGKFQWKFKEHDFGKIPQGTPVTKEFEFTNVGKTPIVLSNAQASCGCTTPSMTKEPVAPGKTGKITVTYSAASPGAFNKSITVYSNASESTLVLYIKGEVTAAPAAPAKPNK
jgi:Protein of unknown function (DUF1573)